MDIPDIPSHDRSEVRIQPVMDLTRRAEIGRPHNVHGAVAVVRGDHIRDPLRAGEHTYPGKDRHSGDQTQSPLHSSRGVA